MGIVIGGLSCRLFMPLLQVLGTAAEQVPPFRLVAARQDYIKLYTVVSVMIVGGFAFIGWMVSKIKIAQVIKLGED
jgi:putative ABC transport system permease protein